MSKQLPVKITYLENSTDDGVCRVAMHLLYMGIPLVSVALSLGVTSTYLRELIMGRGLPDPVEIWRIGRRDEVHRYTAKYDDDMAARLCGVSKRTLDAWRM